VQEMLQDNILDDEERAELFETLKRFAGGDFELGELQKSTSLPLDEPPLLFSLRTLVSASLGPLLMAPEKTARLQ
jgi:hypothetical protein